VKRADGDMSELLRGVEFSVESNWPDLYSKALEKLELYTLPTYKNGADKWKSLKQDKLPTFTPPKLHENAMATQKEMWRIWANKTIKLEELPETNLEAMYTVVLSICDPILKDQVFNHEDYEDIEMY